MPVPDPLAAAPAKPVPPYQPSTSGRVSFLLESASETERNFFYNLLEMWEAGAYDLTEAAFLKGAEAQGISWISEIEEIAAEDKMFCGLRLVMLRNDWCVRFLRRLLDSYDYSNPLTPDDVADNLDAFLLNFHHEIRDARNLIKDHPEAVAAEIRKAIQKHPKLVA
jgi:hypothetical protein